MSDWEEEEAPQTYSLDQYYSLFDREGECLFQAAKAQAIQSHLSTVSESMVVLTFSESL